MKITVLVPTFRRPDALTRCRAALERQHRAPDEVVVVARPDDEATHACLAAYLAEHGAAHVATHVADKRLPLVVAPVDAPGQVAALNRGLDAASGDVIAITDDDAAPHADWLARIEAHFAADAQLGALGGRDWVHEKGAVLNGSRALVGKLTPSGKLIGNHHLGV